MLVLDAGWTKQRGVRLRVRCTIRQERLRKSSLRGSLVRRRIGYLSILNNRTHAVSKIEMKRYRTTEDWVHRNNEMGKSHSPHLDGSPRRIHCTSTDEQALVETGPSDNHRKNIVAFFWKKAPWDSQCRTVNAENMLRTCVLFTLEPCKEGQKRR